MRSELPLSTLAGARVTSEDEQAMPQVCLKFAHVCAHMTAFHQLNQAPAASCHVRHRCADRIDGEGFCPLIQAAAQDSTYYMTLGQDTCLI